MWSQLEAEIHLHRQKTVIKACRGNINLPAPPKEVNIYILICPFARIIIIIILFCVKVNNSAHHGVGGIRKIEIVKNFDEGLGISITVS